MKTVKAGEAKREDLEPGEFRGRVTHVDGRPEHSRASRWCELIGYRNAKDAAEAMAIEEAELAFEGSVARVEIEDHAGMVKKFDVTLRIKAWGDVAGIGISD